MRKPQSGYIFEANNAWHIRFYKHSVNGKRTAKSQKLCNKTADTPSKDSLRVQELAANFMRGVNEANASERNGKGHCCPLCGTRCRRTTEGKFIAKEATQGEVNV